METLFLSNYMPSLFKLDVPQFQLLSDSRFIDYLQKRQIRISKEDLEHFEEIGLFFPVLRLKRPKIEVAGKSQYSGITSSSWAFKEYFKKDLIELSNSTNFKRWNKYRDEDGEENTFLFYHPYQVFNLNRFYNLTQFMLTSSYLERANDCNEMFRQAKKMHGVVKKSLLKARQGWIKEIGLFFELQNAYQPSYRGRIQLTFEDKSLEKWNDWRKNSFSPKKVLENSGFSIENVMRIRDNFAAQARFIDPLKNWYMLVRMMPFRKREKLNGKALLAQDYYEIVGILNLFLRDLTGEEQPEVDDIFDGRGGEWKRKLYGKNFDYADPDIQKKIVSEYLKVPIPKAIFLIEGESEEVTIKILLDAFGIIPEIQGLVIHNFEGTGGISPFNAEAVLRIAKSQNVARYLIVDNDPGAIELVRDLSEKMGLLEADCYRIWEKDFEYDNFGIDAVIETVNKHLVNSGFQPIKKNKVIDRIKMHPTERLMRVIHSICWMINKIEIDDILPKTKLARILAINRAEEIRNEIKARKYEPKWKIEEEITKIHDKFLR